MKILHTSDWHIGRTFHTHSTLGHLHQVLDALVQIVRDHRVDVVAVAGDVFDSAMPSADSYTLLAAALREIRAAGAQVVMTSGNHDSATRLGFQSEWAGLAGIHVVTRPEQFLEPVTLQDEHGPVHFYGIPYLDPALIRHLYPEETLKTHEQVLTFVMRRIRADLAARGGRSVVLSHCFAAGVAASEATDVERDITAGGLDLVPVSVFSGTGLSGTEFSGPEFSGPEFSGPDYVALGHIHGRAILTERVRYSGAPLHYSFSEAGKPRGGWLVDLGSDDGHGAHEARIEWIDLPVPRRLSVLTGEIEELLTDDAFDRFEGDWVSAILTDQLRPLDGMRRLQKRFPFCVTLEHRPLIVARSGVATYGERINRRNDHEIVAGFLDFVRNGVGQTDFERDLVAELLAAGDLLEVTE